MAISTLSGIRICGIASVVPSTIDAYTCNAVDAERLRKVTGIKSRRVAGAGICTSDLCQRAATVILRELGWNPNTVDALLFVSQTGDFILPATACKLQAELGLDKKCAAYDVGLGCSGYIYGLWLSGLMVSNGYKRVLLLAGDTISRLASPTDRATRLIFGDAGTATAIEKSDESCEWTFGLGTDGSGASNLMVPGGGMRATAMSEAPANDQQSKSYCRNSAFLEMNGPEVFAFTIREIPSLVLAVLERAEWEVSQVEHFVFHQANMFMLTHLADSLKIPKSKMPTSLQEFGNTSSASIPLTISSQLRGNLSLPTQTRIVLTGFGVGYSWGAVAMQVHSVVLPEIVEYV